MEAFVRHRDQGEATTDLLCVVAHPDDESFGLGSVLASAAAAGLRVALVCATRGETGEDATGKLCSNEQLGVVREREVRSAAVELGVVEVEVLDFVDSGWDGPAPEGALVSADDLLVRAVHGALDRHRPRVVVTMDPTGSDGHRDHAAIGRATTTAFMQYDPAGAASLYHWCLIRSLMNRWTAERAGDAGVYGEQPLGRPDDQITTVLDGRHVLDVRRRAIAAHATQASLFAGLSPELESAFLAEDHLVRIVPAWEGGPTERALVGLQLAQR